MQQTVLGLLKVNVELLLLFLSLTTHSRQRVAQGVVEEWSNLLTFNAL